MEAGRTGCEINVISVDRQVHNGTMSAHVEDRMKALHLHLRQFDSVFIQLLRGCIIEELLRLRVILESLYRLCIERSSAALGRGEHDLRVRSKHVVRMSSLREVPTGLRAIWQCIGRCQDELLLDKLSIVWLLI